MLAAAVLASCSESGSTDKKSELENLKKQQAELKEKIANYLVGLGARTNLFVLTMLGKTAIVKNYLETFPSYLTARGPHGLTFLHHAQKGGDDAKELLEYFQSKGLKETKQAL